MSKGREKRVQKPSRVDQMGAVTLVFDCSSFYEERNISCSITFSATC